MPIRSESDLVGVRHAVRAATAELRFSIVDQTKLVTAASELGRNALIHGRGGEVLLECVEEDGRRGVRLTFTDRGPGIADLGQAMKDGFTTGTGMGLGLGGSKRLVNEFEIATRVGEGTTVRVTRWTK